MRFASLLKKLILFSHQIDSVAKVSNKEVHIRTHSIAKSILYAINLQVTSENKVIRV